MNLSRDADFAKEDLKHLSEGGFRENISDRLTTIKIALFR